MCLLLCPDEVTVELENVQDKLVELENQVKEFKGDHKNNLFYDIQGKRNELQLKLDEIDLAYQEDLKEVRRGYLGRLVKVSTDLNAKIHEETLDCKTCLERAIVIPQLHRK